MVLVIMCISVLPNKKRRLAGRRVAALCCDRLQLELDFVVRRFFDPEIGERRILAFHLLRPSENRARVARSHPYPYTINHAPLEFDRGDEELDLRAFPAVSVATRESGDGAGVRFVQDKRFPPSRRSFSASRRSSISASASSGNSTSCTTARTFSIICVTARSRSPALAVARRICAETRARSSCGQEIDDALDGGVGAVIGGFETAVGTVGWVGSVMCQRRSKIASAGRSKDASRKDAGAEAQVGAS